jgi:hypothetical protein
MLRSHQSTVATKRNSIQGRAPSRRSFSDVIPMGGEGGVELRLLGPLASGSQSRSPVTRYEVGVHMCGHTNGKEITCNRGARRD